ncbi:MAG: adenosylmethionine decarboxylase [Deltaproteobacteria bacterium]|nr:adenosylmethionine decarboxylase [Deltaproteobacteria bacterium]
MQKLGTHVLVELWQADPVQLDDLEWVRRGLLQAAAAARCTVVGQAFHRYAPQGVSGVVVVAESHISVHTWPEHGYAAIDIFTCGERSLPEAAAQHLIAYSGAKRHFMQVLDRGIPGPG